MISIDTFLINFFANFQMLISRKYIIGKNHFVRLRKMSYLEYVIYIFVRIGNTNYSESIRFYRRFLKKDFQSITRQAINKQRKFISPKLFKAVNDIFVDELYSKFKGLFKINGFLVAAGDTSICDLPHDKNVIEEMEVKKNFKTGRCNTRARISCLLDVRSRVIISSKIVPKKIPEVKLAIDHLMGLKNRMDISKLITTFDRGYASLELMVSTEVLGSKYVIRLRKDTFKNKINKMESNDGIIEINIGKRLLDKIEDKKLRKKAEKLGRIKIRIVKIELKTGEIEILATNLTNDEFTLAELKSLYKKRWEIETGFDRLKNYIRIENFSGRSKQLIEQDFYANIFVYNVCACMKIEASKKIRRQPRNSKHKYVYVINFSRLVTLVYENLFNILSEIRVMIEIIIDFIILEAAKDPTNKRIDVERERGSLADPTNDHNGYKKNPLI